MASEKQGCLTVLLKLIGFDLNRIASRENAEALPYRLRDKFLSPAELSFFQVLRGVTGIQYHIAIKVRVSDLLYVVDRRNNIGHANRIDRKHVDFVLCDPSTMQPKLVIELDDSSHTESDRSNRDDLIDTAFAVADLPILHVAVRKTYSLNGLSELIANTLSEPMHSNPPGLLPTRPPRLDDSSVPLCPNCRIPMVQRQANRGSNIGQPFWGCPSYPDCRAIVPIP